MTTTAEKKRVSKSAVRFVPLDELEVDRSYQRDVNDRSVRKISKGFVAEALGVPLVGQREDATYWLVDGLQRVSALRAMKKNKVLAEVFASRGPEHEAEVFRLVNAQRTRLLPGQLFRAALTEGDSTCWAIKELVEKCGYTLRLSLAGNVSKGKYSAHKEIACVNTLTKIYRDCGPESLEFTLTAIGRAWDNDPLSTYNYILQGLALFHKKKEGAIDLDRLVPRLQSTTPGKLIYSAGLGNWDKGTNLAELLDKLYRRRVGPNRGT